VLSEQHLVFWASFSDAYRTASSAAGQKADLLDIDGTPVGVITLDQQHEQKPPKQAPRFGFIVMAEVHASALSPGSQDDDFPCYLLLAMTFDERTAVTSRAGLAWVSKAVWVASQPYCRLVCLG